MPERAWGFNSPLAHKQPQVSDLEPSTPAVLGGESQVLDLGRSARYFTDSHRRALATSYDACAADGCERPFAWTDVHHRRPWATGGATNLSEAIPLCGFHHRRIHDDRYAHRQRPGPAGTTTVEFHRRT